MAIDYKTPISENTDEKTENNDKTENTEQVVPSVTPIQVLSEIEQLNTIGQEFSNLRKRPLLLLFYSDQCGEIMPADVEHLEHVLGQVTEPLPELDVIIQTRGGEVSASYFIAQLIRSKSHKMYTIIPTFSYSGGTAIALASDCIELHTTSQMSPIDIQIGRPDEKMFPLLNLDGFIDFVNETTMSFKFKDEANRTEIITRIMTEFCRNVDPFNLGELFRLRKLHEIYAEVLLLNYMFKHESDKEYRAKTVIKNLTSGSPLHEFNIDIKLAKQFGLNVIDMNTATYQLSKNLIRSCTEKEHSGIIAPFYDSSHKKRLPYFKLFKPSNLNNSGVSQ